MAKGAFWLFLEKGIRQASSFVVFAVIARILGAEEYGLVALCGIVMILVNNISLGLADGVISMKVRDDLRLSSLFWIMTVSGIVLSLLTYFCAPLFAELFNSPKIASLLRAFSVMPLLFALPSVPEALITASMDFRVFTVRTLYASLLGGAVGLICALRGWGAFALAAQQIVAQLATVFVVWKSTTWRPRLLFSIRALGEVLRLGLGQTGTLFVSFIDQQAPRFVLGYFLGPAAVGYYAFVTRICSAIQDGIIQPVLAVVYPALADIMDDPKEKSKVIWETIFIVGNVMLPVVIGLMLAAPLLVPLLFGQKWLPAIPLLQIFALSTVSFSVNVILRSILRAHRHIGVYFRFQTAIVAAAVGSYLWFASSGLTAIVVIKIAASFVAMLIYSVLVLRTTSIHIFNTYRALWVPLVASLIMGAILLAAQSRGLFIRPTIANLAALTVGGGLCYAAVLYPLERKRLTSAFRRLKGHCFPKTPAGPEGEADSTDGII